MSIIQTKLYQGSVDLSFNEDSHIYYIDDKRVPSVTTILGIINKPALIPWASKMTVNYISTRIMSGVPYDELALQDIFMYAKDAHKYNLQSAGGAGTLVHDWIERYIAGQNPEMPTSEELNRSVNKFLKWVEEYKVEFLASEGKVYSIKHGYTGTFDIIARVNGELVLVDIKTSSGIWPEMWLQTAAYQLARQEEFPEEKYAYRGIIRVDRKEGSFHWAKSAPEDYETHVAGFLACKELYNALEGMKKRRTE